MTFPRKCFLAAMAGLLVCLPSTAQKTPEETVHSFKLAADLEATVWASEPDMVNPTNFDIDERGRIWVCEGANYRAFKTRDEGDRIMILEDTHHTGKCDSYKVFVQDKRLESPLGICKLGNKLYVSQSPNVLVYTIDETGDHPVGEPEVLFTGFQGVNHDHGVHAGIFGPDGRFYFNCGNEGARGIIKHGDKSPVIDLAGSQVGSSARIYKGKPKAAGFVPPREGMAFRCDPDGSNFELLAYNFRNNYELCVDSFGTIWQSDNDDDGNQGCVINYVMEGGNFGYTGPKGTSWGRDVPAYPGQTHQEAQWHQRWPGVVPNMLHTGAGAPCGIVCYEGDLLPEKYRGALIHADAGPNVVRAYFVQPSEHVARGIFKDDGDESALEKMGAGYKAETQDIVKGGDKWFRPDDVCVAPDGALYVSDWYDPGVGGHGTGDTGAHSHNWRLLHGRIYRVAPVGYQPSVPNLVLDTVEGQIAALESPNLARRYLGYTKLIAGGEESHRALFDVFTNSKNEFFRARALWILARGSDGQKAIVAALNDADPNIRVTAIRAARLIKMDLVRVADQMLSDSSPAVLRELCLAMRYEPDERAIPVLVKLADKYDGTDRWYLEAFGIGATDRENEVLTAWQTTHTDKNPKSAQGIIWRLKMTVPEFTPTPPRVRRSTTRPTTTTAPAGPDLLTRDGKKLPGIARLASLTGSVSAGELVYRNANGANCIRCHAMGNDGGPVGPPLTAIGQKLSKAQLYDSILHPSAEILMGYETWVIRTKSGDILTGRKTEDTPDHVTLLDADGKYHDVPTAQIDRKVKQNISLMPEGLCQSMTQQELVDLVEYLSSRK
jgi:putative membrane-bound dehydrogenase-like protein